MKILYTRTLKSGKRQVLVELQHDDEQLMSFRPNQYYKMGEPTEDIVQGYTIIGAWPTDWCSIAQEWQEWPENKS